MGLRFEWDPRKAERNFDKHGVTFDEGTSAFLDPLAAIFDDFEHSSAEAREILIGHSLTGRLIIVSFTERKENVLRIISVRPATRTERNDYERNRKA